MVAVETEVDRVVESEVLEELVSLAVVVAKEGSTVVEEVISLVPDTCNRRLLETVVHRVAGLVVLEVEMEVLV